MYVDPNFKTKKALKDAVKNGDPVRVISNSPFEATPTSDGTYFVEGPHYPEPHKWYAEVTIKGGIVARVK